MNINSSTDDNQEDTVKIITSTKEKAQQQQQQIPSSPNLQSNENNFLFPLSTFSSSLGSSSSSTSTAESTVTTFTFEDKNSLPLSKEYKEYFDNLNVVYVTAVVVCNSANTSTANNSENTRILTDQNQNTNLNDNTNNETNNNNVSNPLNNKQSSNNYLLMFSEVGFLTHPDPSNKVKLITVNTKPNQVLKPGHNHVLTLTSPTTSQKSMDMNSQQVQKLLSGKPKPIRFEGAFPFNVNWNFDNADNNNIKTGESDNSSTSSKFLIPVQETCESNGLIYRARATSFVPQDPMSSSSSSTSCQLVSYQDDDKILCQKYEPIPISRLTLINSNNHTNSNMDRIDEIDNTGPHHSEFEFAIERNNYFQLHELEEESMSPYYRNNNNNNSYDGVVDNSIINSRKGPDLSNLPVDLTVVKKTRKRRTKNAAVALPSSSTTCSLNTIPNIANNNNNNNDHASKVVQKRRSRKTTNIIKVDNFNYSASGSVNDNMENNNSNNNPNDNVVPETSTNDRNIQQQEPNPISVPQTKPKRKRRTKEEIALAKIQNEGVVKRSNKRTRAPKTDEMPHLQQQVDPNPSTSDANDPISLFLLAAQNLDNSTVEAQEPQEEKEEEEDFEDDEPMINNLMLLAQAATSRLKKNNVDDNERI